MQAYSYDFKVKGLYFNELAFIVDINGHDMTITLRGCKQKEDKKAKINWLLRKETSNNLVEIVNLKIENEKIVADMYIKNIAIAKILKDKGLCR